jgi:preprotein translocase subunit SecG
MEQIILVAHVLVALGIIGLIMIQQGKGADMGASFGSGGSQTLFGSTGGGSVLTRATAILVTLFFLSSFGLAYIAKTKSTSAGDVGIPLPAMVEDSAATSSEIPELDEAAIEQSTQEFDIPATDIDQSGSDIPGL